MDDEWSCPGSTQCDATEDMMQVGASKYFSIPSIFSSTLSCVGCVFIIYSYCKWKDIRSGSRSIITFLSIADFFTAFGYIVGSINHFVSYDHSLDRCITFTYICQIQSFVTTWSSLSSFIWTLILAIYLYVLLVQEKVYHIEKLFPIFHILAWGFPIIICLPLLATSHLGYTPYVASTWCYVKVEKLDTKGIFFSLLAGKFWEILTYIFVIMLYILIKKHIKSKKGQMMKSLNPRLLAILHKSDRKLLVVPVLFVLLRCWGTIHFFYSIAVHNRVHNGCISRTLAHIFQFLGFVQAIGDGGQGWGNFILWVMASEKIRKKLFGCCAKTDGVSINHLLERTPTINGQKQYETINGGLDEGNVLESTTST